MMAKKPKKNDVAPKQNGTKNPKPLSVWQPERLTLKEGWQALSKVDKALYIILIAGTLLYNWNAWTLLPDRISLLTWFGYSQSIVSKTMYCIVSFLIMCYLVYRDIINRSVSRRKLFIPFIFYLANYFMINGILGNF